MAAQTHQANRATAVADSRRLQGLAALGIVGSVAAVTMLRDPHVPGSLGMCPSLWLFGVSCPGCGSLRGIHDLVTGDVSAAVGHNLLLIPALLFVVAWAVWALRLPWLAPRLAELGSRWRHSRPARLPIVWGVLAVILSFAVLRNLPGSPLAP